MIDTIDRLTQRIHLMVSQLSSVTKSDKTSTVNGLDKSLALLYNNRGHLYYRIIEFNLAADDYTRAIGHDPNLAVAYYNRATIHYRMDHFDKAFDDFKVAVSLDPKNTEFRLAFDQTLQQMDIKGNLDCNRSSDRNSTIVKTAN